MGCLIGGMNHAMIYDLRGINMRKIEIDIDDFIIRMWEQSVNEIQDTLSNLDGDPTKDADYLKETMSIIMGKAYAIDELKVIYNQQKKE